MSNENSEKLFYYNQKLISLSDIMLPFTLDVCITSSVTESGNYINSNLTYLCFIIKDRNINNSKIQYEMNYFDLDIFTSSSQNLLSMLTNGNFTQNIQAILNKNILLNKRDSKRIKSFRLSIIPRQQNNNTTKSLNDILSRIEITDSQSSPVNRREITFSIAEFVSLISLCNNVKNYFVNVVSLVYNSLENSRLNSRLNIIIEKFSKLNLNVMSTKDIENDSNSSILISKDHDIDTEIMKNIKANVFESVDSENKQLVITTDIVSSAESNLTDEFDDFSSLGSSIMLNSESIRKNISSFDKQNSTSVSKNLVETIITDDIKKKQNNSITTSGLVTTISDSEDINVIDDVINRDTEKKHKESFSKKIVMQKNSPFISNILNCKINKLSDLAYSVLLSDERTNAEFFCPISYILELTIGLKQDLSSDLLKQQYILDVLYRNSIKNLLKNGKVGTFPIAKLDLRDVLKDSNCRENYLRLTSEILYLTLVYTKLQRTIEVLSEEVRKKYSKLYVKTCVIQRFLRYLVSTYVTLKNYYEVDTIIDTVKKHFLEVENSCNNNNINSSIRNEYQGLIGISDTLVDMRFLDQILRDLLGDKLETFGVEDIDNIIKKYDMIDCGQINTYQDVKSYVLAVLKHNSSVTNNSVDDRLKLFFNCIKKYIDNDMYNYLTNSCEKYSDINIVLRKLYDTDNYLEFPEMLLKIKRVMDMNESVQSRVEIINMAKQLEEDYDVLKSRILSLTLLDKLNNNSTNSNKGELYDVESILNKFE